MGANAKSQSVWSALALRANVAYVLTLQAAAPQDIRQEVSQLEALCTILLVTSLGTAQAGTDPAGPLRPPGYEETGALLNDEGGGVSGLPRIRVFERRCERISRLSVSRASVRPDRRVPTVEMCKGTRSCLGRADYAPYAS